MDWIIANWLNFCVVGILLVVGIYMLSRFLLLPSNKQQEKIRHWLLWAVVEAEMMLKSGTGRLKLSYVYDSFKARFPIVSAFLPYSTFQALVDTALEEMRHLIQTNEQIARIIQEGDTNNDI